MTDFKAVLQSLYDNLTSLEAGRAEYAGHAPLDLLNRIEDHRLAVELTEQVMAGRLDEATWRTRLPLSLLVSERATGQVSLNVAGNVAGDVRDVAVVGATELAANLEGYLEAGRLFILFDALNEMPSEGYSERVLALRRFIDEWSPKGNRFLVTCRVLDYGEELAGLQRVEIQPLSDGQIEAFLQKELPDGWRRLWSRLTDQTAGERRLLELARNPYILTMMIDVFAEQGELGRNQAELMERFTQILLSRDKAKYSPDQWLDADVQREALSILAFEMQEKPDSGTRVKRYELEPLLPERIKPGHRWIPSPPLADVLTLAANAHIIEMPVDRSSVRFYHQLLQEYFAARALVKRVSDLRGLADLRGLEDLVGLGEDAPSDLQGFKNLAGHADLRGLDNLVGLGNLAGLWRWPWLESEMPLWQRPDGNFDPLPPPPPTGWEETTILAAGLMPENDDQLLRALIQVNPVLAGRCLDEGRARVDRATRQAVIEALLATIARPEVALRVRIAAGEVLGYLGDPRLGRMVTIPAGEFWMGEGDEKHKLFLPEYQIGAYPLTNVEFSSFIEAGGYQERRWWTEAGWRQKEKKNWTEPRYWNDSRFNKLNQPVVGVIWYELVAYCSWLSAETGQNYRLPTEAEWEKAARGTDGRLYPWGDEFDPSHLNVWEGQVRATTPIGIYPTGMRSFGLFDGAGNVSEWCATAWGKVYPYDVQEDEWREEYLNGSNVRVLRGGSWYVDESFAYCACAFRSKIHVNSWFSSRGCRVRLSPTGSNF